VNTCVQGRLIGRRSAARGGREMDTVRAEEMEEGVFVDSTTMEGQRRIRGYALALLERVDYHGKLERDWSEEALGRFVWERIRKEYASAWNGVFVSNEDLAVVIAITMVEDYYVAYPDQRQSRYAVSGPLPDVTFRRCVVDYLNDLEEFEPMLATGGIGEVAALFWKDVEAHPARWGYAATIGPFVDDRERAEAVAQEAIREYRDLVAEVVAMRADAAA
jgi:hypothetical protein